MEAQQRTGERQRGLEMKLTHLGHIIWGNVLRGTNTPKKDGFGN